jgi:hypothetical protein
MESTGYLQEFSEYIASETGVAFRASLWYKFYLEPDSTAVIAHPSGPDPHVIRLQDVKNLTTSVSGRIIPTLSLVWTKIVPSLFTEFDTLEASAAPPLAYFAFYSELLGLPFVSPCGVPYVNNWDEGQAGAHYTANMHAGNVYRTYIAKHPRFRRMAESRLDDTTVHSNLFHAVAYGLGWIGNNDEHFLNSLMDTVFNCIHILDVPVFYRGAPDGFRKFLKDDLTSLYTIMSAVDGAVDEDFVGDIHLAQALFRWLKVIFEVDFCLVTPFGSAATCKFIMDSTVVISWEPASRT